MKSLKNTELDALPVKDVMEKLSEVRNELFKMQFQSKTNPSSTYSSSRRVLKRNVARILTHLRFRMVREFFELLESKGQQ